jgi:hypothetical protein
MKHPAFGDILKIYKCFLGVKNRLYITGVQIPS